EPAVEREGPADVAARDGGAVVDEGERDDRSEVGPGIERAPELLQQDRLLDEAEADPALVLRDGDAEPAELGEVAPRARIPPRLRLGELCDALGRKALREER